MVDAVVPVVTDVGGAIRPPADVVAGVTDALHPVAPVVDRVVPVPAEIADTVAPVVRDVAPNIAGVLHTDVRATDVALDMPAPVSGSVIDSVTPLVGAADRGTPTRDAVASAVYRPAVDGTAATSEHRLPNDIVNLPAAPQSPRYPEGSATPLAVDSNLIVPPDVAVAPVASDVDAASRIPHGAQHAAIGGPRASTTSERVATPHADAALVPASAASMTAAPPASVSMLEAARASAPSSDAATSGGGPIEVGSAPPQSSSSGSMMTGASSAGTAFFALASLMALFAAAALMLRLCSPPAVWRPGPFLSLAQRPG
jgi:hypothetical protein